MKVGWLLIPTSKAKPILQFYMLQHLLGVVGWESGMKSGTKMFKRMNISALILHKAPFHFFIFKRH